MRPYAWRLSGSLRHTWTLGTGQARGPATKLRSTSRLVDVSVSTSPSSRSRPQSIEGQSQSPSALLARFDVLQGCRVQPVLTLGAFTPDDWRRSVEDDARGRSWTVNT